ncbi:MAG: glycosyltransferase family 4 protein [Phycisphaerae bacterium]
MNILFFAHRYWPSVGGVEKYTQRMAQALVSMGHRVCVVAGATQERLPVEEIHEGVVIHRFPALRSATRCRCWLLSRLRLFTRADIIQVSNTHMLEYYWRMIGVLVDRRKVFLTRHGMSARYPVPTSERRRAVRSLALCSGVAHDGRFIERWLGVKPDICPAQGLHPETDDLQPVPEPPPTSSCYVGRLEPDTGIRIYIDAVRTLTCDMRLPLTLNVYGDGSLASELRQYCRRARLPVRFHGAVADAQTRITESCFAFVDGRMAIQEAMARRRLVFAAYTNPLKRDYLEGESFSPYLIAVASGEELAHRVAYSISHPDERVDLVSRAHAYTRTLSWHHTARSYLQLWEERVTAPRPAVSWNHCLRHAWMLVREA